MFGTVFIFSLLLAGCMTVFAGNAGIVLPLLSIFAFYFSMKSTVVKTLPWTVLMAALVDAVWMHRVPGTVLAVLLVTVVAIIWRKFGDLGSWTSLASAAVWIAVATWVGEFLAVLLGHLHSVVAGDFFGKLLLQILFAEILTPVLVFGLEHILEKRLWVEEGELEDDEG